MPNNDFILIPIQYSDLDPQGHVNNVRFVGFLEQARISYLRRLGLWDGVDFENLGWIVADVHVAFRGQILFGQTVLVHTQVTRLGNKSLRMEYRLEDANSGVLFAEADCTMVTYDFHTHQSVPVWEAWREKISMYEGIPLYT